MASELFDAARRVVDVALKGGAKEARASAYRNRDVDVQWRDGRVEKVSEATTRGVSFQLYVDGRYVALSTSDLRPEALQKFALDGVQMARAITADPFRVLPDKALYAGRTTVNLDLVDPAVDTLDAGARRSMAKALEDAARSVKGADAILSVSTGVAASHAWLARVSSNGFEGEREATDVSLWADVSVKDPDGRRPEDGLSARARYLGDLPPAAELGSASTERALAAIGSKKAESKVMTMVVENRVASRLVGALLGAMTARALQQKQSFLDGKLNSAIASKLLTMIDDPFLPKGLASRAFDGEGISAKKFAVIDGGILKTFYVDDYYGRKLKMAPTTAGSSNLVFLGGKGTQSDLLKSVKDGVLVTGFLGGNTNPTTGDYSLGVQGFRVRDGKRGEPIAETNISGNLLALWQKLIAVGADPYPYGSTKTPTMVFDAVQFAGS
ncbi:TldD/PmbA family protein [soil metagenome]